MSLVAEARLDEAAVLLARQYGLDAAAIGPTVLATAMDDAAAALGLTVPLLAARLGEPVCISALFNALPVGLSWFERDAAQLRSAATWAVARRRPLRVLSAPCARGEEVWSLAAALLDAGMEPGQVRLLGIDAMPAAIERAESGRYPVSAGVPIQNRPWWLVEVAQELHVHPRLRSLARFRTANLLDPADLADLDGFDLIFSRNFLIYLTASARRQWLERISRWLAVDGRVYVAASEPLCSWSTGFRPSPGDVPGVCVPIPPPAAATAPIGRAVLPPEPVRRRRTEVVAPATLPQSAVAAAVDVASDPRVLADAGELEAAEALLLTRLASPVPAADDLVTLALIDLARGQLTRAEDALRRALYLQHGHAEAVDLLAALLDQRGEVLGARRLRSRAGARA